MTIRFLPATLLILTLALTGCAGGPDDGNGQGADQAGMTAGTVQDGGPAPLAASSRAVRIVAVGVPSPTALI